MTPYVGTQERQTLLPSTKYHHNSFISTFGFGPTTGYEIITMLGLAMTVRA